MSILLNKSIYYKKVLNFAPELFAEGEQRVCGSYYRYPPRKNHFLVGDFPLEKSQKKVFMWS